MRAEIKLCVLDNLRLAAANEYDQSRIVHQRRQVLHPRNRAWDIILAVRLDHSNDGGEYLRTAILDKLHGAVPDVRPAVIEGVPQLGDDLGATLSRHNYTMRQKCSESRDRDSKGHYTTVPTSRHPSVKNPQAEANCQGQALHNRTKLTQYMLTAETYLGADRQEQRCAHTHKCNLKLKPIATAWRC